MRQRYLSFNWFCSCSFSNLVQVMASKSCIKHFSGARDWGLLLGYKWFSLLSPSARPWKLWAKWPRTEEEWPSNGKARMITIKGLRLQWVMGISVILHEKRNSFKQTNKNYWPRLMSLIGGRRYHTTYLYFACVSVLWLTQWESLILPNLDLWYDILVCYFVLPCWVLLNKHPKKWRQI